MVTNSHFNLWMSLFKFIESQSFDFDVFIHDSVLLSPVLQQRLVGLDRYGYVYIRMLFASPAQESIVTFHVTHKNINDAGTHIWLKKSMEQVHDAFRLNRIPFINVSDTISESEWATFMSSASIDDIDTQLGLVPSAFYTHNGEEIEFFLSEFGELEPVELDGSIGQVTQISLQHYAPDNLTNPS